ncbi:MAG TPA: YfiR family protein [Bryobacteraceae bacterium]|nr:YfiR family protein [Bryobacteraceae bacterium]
MRLRIAGILFVLLSANAGTPSTSPGADAEAEDELKSVIIKNFVRYSTWPEPASSSAPITIGILGRTSFTQTLHTVLDGKPVNGRPIQVVELKSVAELHRCHLIYFATDKNADTKQALQSIRSAHTLTIGEDDRFLDYGGAVKLQLIDGHMGFEVSLEALDRAGIEISSKLLRLGQIKRRRDE